MLRVCELEHSEKEWREYEYLPEAYDGLKID
jgi:hypothetical protein